MFIIKQLFTLSGFTVLANLLYVAALPVLAIFYSPENFGVFGKILAAGGILQVLCSLRLEKSVLLAHNTSDYPIGIMFVLVIACCISSLIGICIVISSVFFEFQVVELLASLLYALFASVFLVYTNTLVSKKEYLELGLARFLRKLLEVSFAILFGYMLAIGEGLIYSVFLAQIILITYYTWKYFKAQNLEYIFSKISIADSLKDNFQFPRYDVPSSLLSQISVAIPIFFIGPHYGMEALGLYVLTTRILSAPMTAIGKPMQDIARNIIADSIELSERKIRRIFIKLLTVLFLSALLIYSSIYFIFEYFSTLNRYSEWSESVNVLLFLCPLYVCRLAISPFMVVLTMKKKLNLQFKIQLVSSLFMCMLVLGAYFSDLDLYSLLLLYSLVYVLSYSYTCYTSYRVITEHAK